MYYVTATNAVNSTTFTTLGIMSVDLQNYHRFTLGSPVLPSHPSNWELESLTGLNLPFWRRLVNFVNTWWSIHSWFNNLVDKQQKIAEKYFGNDIPHIIDVAKNMSLILINQEPLLAYARPEIPSIVHFSGLHLAKTPPPLPKVRYFMITQLISRNSVSYYNLANILNN